MKKTISTLTLLVALLLCGCDGALEPNEEPLIRAGGIVDRIFFTSEDSNQSENSCTIAIENDKLVLTLDEASTFTVSIWHKEETNFIFSKKYASVSSAIINISSFPQGSYTLYINKEGIFNFSIKDGEAYTPKHNKKNDIIDWETVQGLVPVTSELYKGYWIMVFDDAGYEEDDLESMIGVSYPDVYRCRIWSFLENGKAYGKDISMIFFFYRKEEGKAIYNCSMTSKTITLKLLDNSTDKWTGTWNVARDSVDQDVLILSQGTRILRLQHSEINPLSPNVEYYVPSGTTFSVGEDSRCRAHVWEPIPAEDFKEFAAGGYWVNIFTTSIDENGIQSPNWDDYWDRVIAVGGDEDSPPYYTFDKTHMTMLSHNYQHYTTFYYKSDYYTYKADDGNSIWIKGEKQPCLQVLHIDREKDLLCAIEYLGWSPRRNNKYGYSIYHRQSEAPYPSFF